MFFKILIRLVLSLTIKILTPEFEIQMNDRQYMHLAHLLAKKGKGLVSPNPLVGAVLIKNGKVIGKGYHKKYGSDHAEVDAIKYSKEDVAGSTLYCNLEPCCHTNKQTPPCVPLIIQKKIKRVVISNIDPNKEVNGKGIRQLRNAGIEVITRVLENEGKELNKFYFKNVSEQLPYVTIKIAQSIDGKISSSNKKQTWLTGKESVKYVHELRNYYDAVLVGANTIKSDDPLLTVREVSGRNPVRIIIDGKLSTQIKSKVFDSDEIYNTWVFTTNIAVSRKLQKLQDLGVKLFVAKKQKNDQLKIKDILKTLAKNKITSVLVEGGANIFTQFIESDLFDEIIILQAPTILGKGIGSTHLSKKKDLKLLSSGKLGYDIKMVFGKKFSD